MQVSTVRVTRLMFHLLFGLNDRLCPADSSSVPPAGSPVPIFTTSEKKSPLLSLSIRHVNAARAALRLLILILHSPTHVRYMAASILRLPNSSFPGRVLSRGAAAVSYFETDSRHPRKVHYTAARAVFQGERDDLQGRRRRSAAALVALRVIAT